MQWTHQDQFESENAKLCLFNFSVLWKVMAWNEDNHKIMLSYQLSECHSMLDTNVTAYTDVAVLNEHFSHLLLISALMCKK